jgi:hypothetical protein
LFRSIAKPHVIHHRGLHHSFRSRQDNTNQISLAPAPKGNQHSEEPSLPSFSLFQQIRDSKPAVRYIIYAGLGLMATVETTFWFNVLRAKFFPGTSDKKKVENEEFLQRLRDAVKGYRTVWMKNYGRYYGAYVWGLGYGGLDRIDQ